MWQPPRGPRALTSDQGLVYHLKQGLSKQVLSSGGFLASPHSGPLRVCGFPLASSMQRTSRLFTPRPQVVLHWGPGDRSAARGREHPGNLVKSLWLSLSRSIGKLARSAAQ